jgi:hypothetical protein
VTRLAAKALDALRGRGARLLVLAALAFGAFVPAGCGKGAGDQAGVVVAGHAISVGTVQHWLSVLVARGGNGRGPGPPTPEPPDYTACIAYSRAHPPSTTRLPDARLRGNLKAYCALQHRRFRLKALYLLITYRWITGEAAELGVHLDRPELARELAGFRRALGLSTATAYGRYLHFLRADDADIRLSFELEQLVGKIEAKVAAAGGGPSTPAGHRALVGFGEAFKQRWVTRTDCRPPYVVPICRQYKPPQKPPELTPPGIPFADAP